MKRIASSVLLLLLAIALTGPTVARANSAHPPMTNAQKQAQKDFNKYYKHQEKLQKKAAKTEKKQMKQWKKQHGNTTTTVT